MVRHGSLILVLALLPVVAGCGEGRKGAIPQAKMDDEPPPAGMKDVCLHVDGMTERLKIF